MVDRGLEPNVTSCNILIDGYCKNHMLDEALQLFKKMRQNELKPTIVTCNVLLRGLYWDGRMKTAQRFPNEMQSFGQSPDEVSYGKLEDARKLLDEMPEKGLVPNVVTCTTMIAGLFHHRMSLEANKLIIQMEEKGCLLDSRTYDTIIKGFLQGKETEKALQFLRKMHERKFVPSDPVVSLLIKTLSTDELKNLVLFL
ncbi:pentatricopeptide repeat-containing protein At1g62680, mitochondrial-like [Papaver somniferum]|uniref:pentatricopeptide repeat-containing protein At1g62680, mitochondrial-like n=1 Tax=Papaver somniferum TaxID=3469 RepID=UPI000E6FF9FE|nr:pentatricopeptide repeat-containing protein At1g62680, mitochondrial-like [Papaver somniferum]